MINIRKIGLFILFLFGISIFPYFSIAENQIDILESDIIIEISPNNPGPNENISISISSYSTDLNKSVISWQKDNEKMVSGIGITNYQTKTGKVDTPVNINLSIRPSGSLNTINKQIVMVPSEMDIMWESLDGYTPPFYKGKALPTVGGMIKVVAIPSSNTIKSGSGDINYVWKNSEGVVSDLSGYNKNSYIFKNSLFENNQTISVSASSLSNDYVAEKTIEIPTYNPKIIFYKKSPTEGILYANALDKETTMAENEMTIIAEPYFMSKKNNNMLYSWKINGKPIETPIHRNEITIKPTSRGGYATIGLTIENLGELFQKISNNIKINL